MAKRDVLNAEKIEYIDLLLVLRSEQNKSYYFEHDSHLNVNGNEILASIITKWVLEKELNNKLNKGADELDDKNNKIEFIVE